MKNKLWFKAVIYLMIFTMAFSVLMMVFQIIAAG